MRIVREHSVKTVLLLAVLAAAAKPIAWEDTQFTVSASIGFAVFPQEGRNAKLLLEAADAAMYRAKQAGRNRADFGTAQAESE